MSHTKGPWKVVEERGARPQIFINGFQSGSIAKMYNRMNWQTDARLIAAAPDLLDAIDYALHMLLSLPSGIDEDADENDTSPDDMVAHVGGLIFRKLQAAKSEAEGV